MTDQTPIETGALARVHTVTPNLLRPTVESYPVGFRFVVEDFVSADEDDDGAAFYWGSANGGGNNVAVRADAVEPVMSARQAGARRPPSRDDILRAISSELCGTDADSFTTDETNRDGDVVHVYGETADGLRFAFTVSVDAIRETDL